MSFGRSQGQNAGSDLTKPDVFASADSVVTIRSSSASEQDVTDQSRAIQTGISPPKDKRTDETGLRSDTLREGAIRVSPLTSTPLDQTLAMKYSSPGPNDSVDPVNESGDHLLGQPFERFDQVEVLTSMGEDENESLQFEKELTRRMFSLMLEYKIWAEHRPQAESVRHSTRLVNDLDAIEARENKQESARHELVNFVARVRQALSALTQV